MRLSTPLAITLVVSVFLVGCGGQETSAEKAEEEGGAEETTTEETTTEETTSLAEVTAEETIASAQAAIPEPTGEARAVQKEERINASPEKAIGDLAKAEEGVGVTQTATPDPATVGRPLTFTITVTNNSAPQHVGLKDFLPEGMELVSATSSQGTCNMGHHGDNDVVCTLGEVPNGGSVTVEVGAIPTVAGTMTNIVNAGGGSVPVTSVPATITVNPASGADAAHASH